MSAICSPPPSCIDSKTLLDSVVTALNVITLLPFIIIIRLIFCRNYWLSTFWHTYHKTLKLYNYHKFTILWLHSQTLVDFILIKCHILKGFFTHFCLDGISFIGTAKMLINLFAYLVWENFASLNFPRASHLKHIVLE